MKNMSSSLKRQQDIKPVLEIQSQYLSLYPNCDSEFDRLMDMVEGYANKRSKALKKRDLEGIGWIESSDTVGMMLYVDLFSDTIDNLIRRSDYFENLGITLIHLMPILEPRSGENDGGYAVKNYREIDPKLGDMVSFEKMVSHYHKKGIRICIDYVINHTSDDHEWAKKALEGDRQYQGYYFFFEDNSIPKLYEQNLNEVFPKVSPGNFTFVDDIDQWVMTTFYSFQWDLNYQNPTVFHEMAANLLYLANKGVDMIRLDAIPYIWKRLGTSCRNLPEVYEILSLYRKILSYVAPSAALLGEAIVQPDQIVKYFGTEEKPMCHALYNASFMVEIWNAVATRDARYIVNTPSFITPKGATWINYARCHDDIGWGLDVQKIQKLGFDPQAHKLFLIDFYHGCLKDSFAKGALYEFDPQTLDARISGTLASLAGLETAIDSKDRYQKEMALKRIEFIHGLFIFKHGIPMLYSGDEIATINDYSYKNDAYKWHDSRWVHRAKLNWRNLEFDGNVENACAIIFQRLKVLIHTRKTLYSKYKGCDEQFIALSNNHVLAIKQELQSLSNGSNLPHAPAHEDMVIQLFNCSEDKQIIYTSELKRHNLQGIWCDAISGKKVDLRNESILLGPYEIFILQSAFEEGKCR